LGGGLWIDEGISVGIATHRLSEIPGLLAYDGSPPLYYVLLHGWIRLFGTSETAIHALSLVVSTVTVPAALWAGWSLFGRRVGWLLAGLVAFSPYLSYFATEARMYSLVVLLALAATASFLHAFAFGRRRHLWVFAVSLALLLYTHNWGLWLAAGAAAALIPCATASPDRRRMWRDGAACFAAVGLAYLPWVPTLASQLRHTGAPWSQRPEPREAVSVVASVLGDPHERVLVALLLVAGPCLWSAVRRSPDRPAVLATAVVASIPVVLGWLGAQISPSWAPRYLAVCAPAVLLLAAVGLSRARAQGLAALGLILILWIQPFARLSGRLEEKATVRPLAMALSPGLKRGDLVIVMQMEEVPVLAYYLPDGLHFSTATGPVLDPGVADWRNALARTRAATVSTALAPQLDRTPVGSDILLVCAQPGTGPSSLPWFALMERHCAEWRSALMSDPRFARVTTTARAASSPTEVGRPTRQILQLTKTSQ
jgi:mannosyltransferase